MVDVDVDIVKVAVRVCPAPIAKLVGLTETRGPAGDIPATRFTVKAKPLTLVMLIVDVPEFPGVIVSALGLALMIKSGLVVVLKVAV